VTYFSKVIHVRPTSRRVGVRNGGVSERLY